MCNSPCLISWSSSARAGAGRCGRSGRRPRPASASRTRKRAQSSSSWCQSLQERASRLISRPRISPTWSRATSASSRWKPGRPSIDWPLLPRSSSMTVTAVRGQPRATARSARAYWRAVDSLVVEDLLGGRLADVDDGGPVEVPGPELRGGGRIKRCGRHDAPPAAGPPRRSRSGRAGRRGVAGASACGPAGAGSRRRSAGPAAEPGAGGHSVRSFDEHGLSPWPRRRSHHAASASRASVAMVTGRSCDAQVVASRVF